MSATGVQVSSDALAYWGDFKKDNSLLYVIFKISDDGKVVEVDQTQKVDIEKKKAAEREGTLDAFWVAQWDEFREKLQSTRSKDNKGIERKGCRYAGYKFGYPNPASTESVVEIDKVLFVSWTPADPGVMMQRVPMVYAGTRQAVKNSLQGMQIDVQANDDGDIEYDVVRKLVTKGR